MSQILPVFRHCTRQRTPTRKNSCSKLHASNVARLLDAVSTGEFAQAETHCKGGTLHKMMPQLKPCTFHGASHLDAVLYRRSTLLFLQYSREWVYLELGVLDVIHHPFFFNRISTGEACLSNPSLGPSSQVNIFKSQSTNILKHRL